MTYTDIDEVITSCGADYALCDDDFQLVADSMGIDFDEASAFYYG